jgi:hypothetical protein
MLAGPSFILTVIAFIAGVEARKAVFVGVSKYGGPKHGHSVETQQHAIATP